MNTNNFQNKVRMIETTFILPRKFSIMALCSNARSRLRSFHQTKESEGFLKNYRVKESEEQIQTTTKICDLLYLFLLSRMGGWGFGTNSNDNKNR